MLSSAAWNPGPLTYPLLAAGALGLTLAIAIWRERPKAGAAAIAVQTLLVACWSGGQALLVSAGTVEAGVLGLRVTLVALAAAGPVWVVFALQYTGRSERLTPRVLGLLVAEPLAFLLLLATNDAHALVYAEPRLTAGGAEAAFAYERGPAYAPHYLAQYALMAGANWILAEKFLASRNVYRTRTFVLIGMSVSLTTAHAVSLAGLSPLPHTALGPLFNLAFAAAGFLLVSSDRALARLPVDRALSSLSGRWQSLTPLARETALERLETGFVVTDHENRIVDVNPRGKAILGAADERVVGRRVTDVIPDESIEGADVPFIEPHVTGEFRGVWVPVGDGQRRCYDLTIAGVPDAAEPAGRVSLIHDVTDRERRKQALEARTAELERQNEQLEQFANVVSHDLRNPLTVAAGRLEVVDAGDDQEHVDTALRSLDRMEEIVDDVLTLAALGQSISDTRPVEVQTVARDAWETVPTPNARLDADLDLRVESDPQRLRQVFENLFRNSVEHGAPERSELAVRVGRLDDGFFVEDDGAGIPPDVRDRVFDHGFSAADSGTGFGLAIVRTIAEAHGWTVTAGEGSDGGARFAFTDVDEAVPADLRAPTEE